jgi:hypothetical protein
VTVDLRRTIQSKQRQPADAWAAVEPRAAATRRHD